MYVSLFWGGGCDPGKKKHIKLLRLLRDELVKCFCLMAPRKMTSGKVLGEGHPIYNTLRLHGMSCGVKTNCFKASGVSLGGSGVSIGGVRSLRVVSP